MTLKCFRHNQESILALRSCNTSSLPLDHLAYTVALTTSLFYFTLSRHGWNEQRCLALKCFRHNQESILALRTCNTSSLPLDHLAYTCFNSFFILLNSFSSRVELIKMVSTTARIDPYFFLMQNQETTTRLADLFRGVKLYLYLHNPSSPNFV